jgi:hypothetical protein
VIRPSICLRVMDTRVRPAYDGETSAAAPHLVVFRTRCGVRDDAPLSRDRSTRRLPNGPGSAKRHEVCRIAPGTQRQRARDRSAASWPDAIRPSICLRMMDTRVRPAYDGETSAAAPHLVMSRTRCSVLDDAPLSRDRSKRRLPNGPGSAKRHEVCRIAPGTPASTRPRSACSVMAGRDPAIHLSSSDGYAGQARV